MKPKYFNLYYLYYFVDAYITKELILEWKPEMGIEAMDNIQMPEFELSEYSADECAKDTGKVRNRYNTFYLFLAQLIAIQQC